MEHIQKMIRVGHPIPPEEIFPLVSSVRRKVKKEGQSKKREINIQGYLIKMSSVRYRTFAQKGCKCIRCGIEGLFFAIEQPENNKGNNPDRYHLNLYAIKNGKEVLMTVDHIVPDCRGGKRVVENLQPMCSPCNSAKASLPNRQDILRHKKNHRTFSFSSSQENIIISALNQYEELYGPCMDLTEIRNQFGYAEQRGDDLLIN